MAAYTQFIYIENLVSPAAPATPAKATPAFKRDSKLEKLLPEAVDTAAGDDGWANLASVGQNLSRLASDFDSRTWGYGKLKDLTVAHPSYDVVSRSPGDGNPKVSVVRSKPRK